MKLTKTHQNFGHIIPSKKDHSQPNPRVGKAHTSTSLLNDFIYLEYDLGPNECNEINLDSTPGEGFYFIHCWKGNLNLTIGGGEEKTILPFQSAIVFDENSDGVALNLSKKSAYQFCVIGFSKPSFETPDVTNSFYYKFKSSFCKYMPRDTGVFISRPYLKLIEKINALSRTSKKNLASELVMEGLIYQVLGLKMEQFLNTVNSGNLDYGSLSLGEMEKIQEISEFIRQNPALEYNVDFLCRETSLSPSKLQEGFKKMYNRTVIDFIRNIRLEKSLELINTTDLNISEIVYSIGLTSRSYFSKIFKNKYSFSPKNFRELTRTNALSS